MTDLYFLLTFILLLFWTVPWKAVALWKAARNGHKKWFIVLFFLNTLAILEIIYIFHFGKPTKLPKPYENTKI